MDAVELSPPLIDHSPPLPQHIGLAAAGHVAFGACVGFGLAANTKALMASIVGVPLAITVALLSMLPLFYLVLTLRGNAPALGQVVKASVIGWRDVGLIMLGAAPAAWFLITSFQHTDTALLLLFIETFLCARLGLASFRRNAITTPSTPVIGSIAFTIWGALVVTMAVRLYMAWVIQ